MELLNTDLISGHFLTPKMFESMKFVSHCSSVRKGFSSNFQGIVSTLEKMNTPETDALQETILSLHFVSSYFVLKDCPTRLLFTMDVSRNCRLDFASAYLHEVSLVLNNLQNNQGLLPISFNALKLLQVDILKAIHW